MHIHAHPMNLAASVETASAAARAENAQRASEVRQKISRAALGIDAEESAGDDLVSGGWGSETGSQGRGEQSDGRRPRRVREGEEEIVVEPISFWA